MARENMGTNIEPGIIARVVAGIKYAVSGVGPDNWFGPQQPLAPQAQDKTEGRRFDYPVGYNLKIQPRSEENVSFSQLRALADGYDLLRLVIETRKDQLESFEWEFVPKEANSTVEQFADQIKKATDFLEYPDKEHNWTEWLRMIVEDLLVIDAICIYPRMNRGGALYGFELVDGATIKRLLDVDGRTPLSPSPAYQQVLKGIPAADYSIDQLIYLMRNPRTSRIYGMSPVEQVMMTVNIAVRRQISQLNFYTEGNIPEAIAQLPKDWTPDLVKEFQGWWDSLMEGNLAQRRKMKFIPNLEGILFPKKEILKDEYDEWLARIICFAFSVTPTAFVKMVNRASGEQMAETAKEEGMLPLLRWFEAKMTFLVAKYLGCPDIRFQWKLVNKIDPSVQATIHATYINTEVMTPDEVREDLGMDRLTPEERQEAFPMPAPFEQTIVPVEPNPNAGAAPVEPVAPEPTEKIVVNVSPPEIHLGDTFVRVMPAESPVIKVDVPAPVVNIEAPAAPQITVNTPDVKVEPADVQVTLGDVTVNADMRGPVNKSVRTIKAMRQEDGSLIAKFEDNES